jgi:hypothetical protein
VTPPQAAQTPSRLSPQAGQDTVAMKKFSSFVTQSAGDSLHNENMFSIAAFKSKTKCKFHM